MTPYEGPNPQPRRRSNAKAAMLRALEAGAQVNAECEAPAGASVEIEGCCRHVSYETDPNGKSVLLLGISPHDDPGGDAGYITVPRRSLRSVEQVDDHRWSLQWAFGSEVRLWLNVTLPAAAS